MHLYNQFVIVTLLVSANLEGKPGPKGSSPELIQAIVELIRRNPRFGCLGIAQQINKAFRVDINKDLVRRVLAKHYRPKPDDNGPSWLTFIGHAKDSLFRIDIAIFRYLNQFTGLHRFGQCRPGFLL